MFRSQFVSLVLLTGLIVPFTATAARAGFVRLTLESEPGDFIGQGNRFDLTYDTSRGDRITARIPTRLSDNSPAQLYWDFAGSPLTSGEEYGSVSFGTYELGIPIRPGVYPEARRADFAPPGFAGLDLGFQSRGSNEVFGSFTINEVTFTPDLLEVLTFDAEFLQRSESPFAPALRGRFQFNAQTTDPSTAVPEPSSILAMVSSGCVLIYGRIRRRREKSTISRQDN
jgi:hypothetical protein